MKSQDIVILLKIVLYGQRSWRTTDLANELFISQSEVSKSLKRSELAKLYNPHSRSVAKRPLLDFIAYGLPYAFPAEIGKLSKGVATAISSTIFKNHVVSDDNYVWPHIDGTLKGESVKPLYPNLPLAALKDSQLHDLMALVDAIRIGRVREVAWAKDLLKKRILKHE